MKIISLVLGGMLTIPALLGAQAPAFVPLVKGVDALGTCEPVRVGLRAGDYGALLRIKSNDSVEHVVIAIWDSSGTLRHYVDDRGDLRAVLPQSRRGDATTILLELDQQVGILE